jgi:hypothetical protein
VKKINEPGDLGGTNGTVTVSEAPAQDDKKSDAEDVDIRSSSSSSEGKIPIEKVEKQ